MSAPVLPRSEFAVTENYIYLNHAAVGILPRRSRTALDAFVAAQGDAGVMGTHVYEAKMPHYRARIASYIGAKAHEIAILRNTNDGATAIAQGLDWKPGDEVLLCNDEFPANAIPWLALRARGVNVRLLDASRERMTPDVLRREITNRTRVVTVSWVGFHDGYRHDLAALSEITHASGALFAVDAIQALGAFAIDVEALGIDALYAGGQKWMLSLQGVSFLYLRETLLEKLALGAPGWRSVEDMWDFLNYDQPLATGASRFEGGTPNFIGALSLERAVDLFMECDSGALQRHVLALTDRLADGLLSAGCELLSDRSDETSSGIVTFRVPGAESVALGKAIQADGAITTWRPTGIRAAPHGYNTIEEIDQFLELLAHHASAAVTQRTT